MGPHDYVLCASCGPITCAHVHMKRSNGVYVLYVCVGVCSLRFRAIAQRYERLLYGSSFCRMVRKKDPLFSGPKPKSKTK